MKGWPLIFIEPEPVTDVVIVMSFVNTAVTVMLLSARQRVMLLSVEAVGTKLPEILKPENS